METQNTALDTRYEGSLNIDMERLAGFSASEGVIDGPCTVIKDHKDLYNLREGAIVVCEAATPELISFMPYIRGLVTEKGGAFTVATWHARRYGIPTVTGVAGIMESIRDGDIICIYGSKGVVEIVR